MTTVLPKELRLGGPPTMPQARSYLFRQQSTLATYDPEQQIQINIPRLQRSYLRKDSYLQFRLNGQYQPDLVVDGNLYQYSPDLVLDDAGAWGLFERIEVFDYLGSTVLENIDGLPQLASLLMDMGTDFTDPNHEGQIAHGLMQDYSTSSLRNDGGYYQLTSTADITFPLDASTDNYNLGIFNKSSNKTFTITVSKKSYANIDTLLTELSSKVGTSQLKFVKVSATKLQIVSPYPFQVGAAVLFNIGDNLKLPLDTDATEITGGAGFTSSSSSGLSVSYYQGGLPLVAVPHTTTSVKSDFSVQFSIPLLSFLGVLSKKMVPLHNGFSIVLTLANQNKPIFISPKQTILSTVETSPTTNLSTAATIRVENTSQPVSGHGNINGIVKDATGASSWKTPVVFWWQLSDVNLVCQILELGPIAESMLLSTSQGQPLILHTKSLRYYRGNSTKNQSEFQLPLNLNVSSLTNVLWFMRPENTEDDLRYQNCGARHRNFLQRWEFQYGSTTLPQSNGIQSMYIANPPTFGSNQWQTSVVGQDAGFTECYSELVKARPCFPEKGRLSIFNYGCTAYPGLGDWIGFANAIEKSVSFGAGHLNPTGVTPKFACGLTLELTNGKSGDLICGLNTNGMNTSIRGYFHPNRLSDHQKFDVTIDAYAEYDAFINISPGIATTVSF